MKVIKQGVWEKRIMCKGCKSVLQAEGSDVRYGLYSSEYEDEFKGSYYIPCPVCERANIVKEKDVPSYVRDDAVENRKD